MTAEIVNLRLERKRKARAARSQQAAENRAAHGQPKPEKRRSKAERLLARRTLDGVRRRSPETEP
jgi:hypothetical protein